MSSPTSASTTTTTCPACGTAGSGHFCANCGASLQGAACAACNAPLSPGAKFCHRCGTPAGARGVVAARAAVGSGRGVATALPWTVAAIALLALIALSAGQRFNRPVSSTLDAPSNALPQAGLDDRGPGGAPLGAPGGPFAGAPGAAGRAPDISGLSPEERATRLFDRIIRYDEEGKKDSLQFFAPMALAVYQSIPSPTTDQRYDLGRIGEVTGDYGVAKAQADTILQGSPTHLLALSLRARMSIDPKERADYQRRILAAEATERQKNLPEYQAHAADVERAVTEAKRGQQ
jgi:hypothetical protein